MDDTGCKRLANNAFPYCTQSEAVLESDDVGMFNTDKPSQNWLPHMGSNCNVVAVVVVVVVVVMVVVFICCYLHQDKTVTISLPSASVCPYEPNT